MCHNGKRERELESKATFSDDVGNVNACAAGWRITVLFKLFHCSVVFRSLYTTRSLPPRQLDYVFLVDFVVISALLLFVARRVARAFLPSMWIYLCIFFSFFLPRSKILCNLRANGEKILRKNNKGTRCKIYVQTHALPYHYPYKNKHFKASGITKSRCCVEEKKHSETKIITCLQFKNFCLTRVFLRFCCCCFCRRSAEYARFCMHFIHAAVASYMYGVFWKGHKQNHHLFFKVRITSGFKFSVFSPVR